MGRDRISELPDYLLTQILSYLPTKDSVKTSVLSTRWNFIWLMVYFLYLKLSDSPTYVSIDKFMEFDEKSRMLKFKIKEDKWMSNCRHRIVEWIGTAIDRGVQYLDVESVILRCLLGHMPQKIYKSKTLVSLKLVRVRLDNPRFGVSLPCLKTMHLERIRYVKDPLLMEELISGCPVLEDLSLIKPLYGFNQASLLSLRVRSQILKRFRVIYENDDMVGLFFSIEIDAAQLEYMNFGFNHSDRIVVENLSSLLMIEVDSEFSVGEHGTDLAQEDLTTIDTIRDFLTGISSVRHMVISQRTLKVLHRYSKLRPIPKFFNLCRLVAAFSTSTLQLLPTFLESCPNLKNLILDFSGSWKREQTELTDVPQCLLSSLECVEIKGLAIEKEAGKKLARYFLENSLVLRKFILHFKDSVRPERDIFDELRRYAKGSCSCQIIIYRMFH